jgi:hypothetical protein
VVVFGRRPTDDVDSLLYDLNRHPVSENKALLEIINSCEWSSLAHPRPGCVEMWRESRTPMPQQVHGGRCWQLGAPEEKDLFRHIVQRAIAGIS